VKTRRIVQRCTQSAEYVCLSLMEKITSNNTMMIAWQDQKLNSISGIRNKDSILEFQIPRVGGVKSQDSSSQESRSAEMRNTEIPKQAH
jgi:hypothetical protein